MKELPNKSFERPRSVGGLSGRGRSILAGRSTRSLDVIGSVVLKANIAKNVPSDQVRLKVPHEFQSALDPRMLQRGSYTVIAFPGMRNESSSIVDSGAIVRALAKVEGASQHIVAVAHNFTTEAHAILDQRGALRFSTNDFFWTDESLASIRSNQPK